MHTHIYIIYACLACGFYFLLQIYVHDADEDAEYPFASGATLRSAQRFAHATPCDVSDKGILHQVLFSFPPQPTSLNLFSAQHEKMEVHIWAYRIKTKCETVGAG